MKKPTKTIKKAPNLGSTKPKVDTEPKAKKLKLEVEVNDLSYKATANNLHEALTDFVASPEFPFAIKTRVLIKFSQGKEESQRFYHVAEGRRLFRLMAHDPAAIEILATKLIQQIA